MNEKNALKSKKQVIVNDERTSNRAYPEWHIRNNFVICQESNGVPYVNRASAGFLEKVMHARATNNTNESNMLVKESAIRPT